MRKLFERFHYNYLIESLIKFKFERAFRRLGCGMHSIDKEVERIIEN